MYEINLKQEFNALNYLGTLAIMREGINSLIFEFIYKIRMSYYNYYNGEKKPLLDLNLRQINMDFECTFLLMYTHGQTNEIFILQCSLALHRTISCSEAIYKICKKCV